MSMGFITARLKFRGLFWKFSYQNLQFHTQTYAVDINTGPTPRQLSFLSKIFIETQFSCHLLYFSGVSMFNPTKYIPKHSSLSCIHYVNHKCMPTCDKPTCTHIRLKFPNWKMFLSFPCSHLLFSLKVTYFIYLWVK